MLELVCGGRERVSRHRGWPSLEERQTTQHLQMELSHALQALQPALAAHWRPQHHYPRLQSLASTALAVAAVTMNCGPVVCVASFCSSLKCSAVRVEVCCCCCRCQKVGVVPKEVKQAHILFSNNHCIDGDTHDNCKGSVGRLACGNCPASNATITRCATQLLPCTHLTVSLRASW